jgi:hypothetical protein
VTQTQAPLVASNPRPADDSGERRLQDQIDLMQEQIRILSAQTDSNARILGGQMGPKWIEKVQAARASASRASERMRYLESTKALLARRLESLRMEQKVYEDFQRSEPTAPRR